MWNRLPLLVLVGDLTQVSSSLENHFLFTSLCFFALRLFIFGAGPRLGTRLARLRGFAASSTLQMELKSVATLNEIMRFGLALLTHAHEFETAQYRYHTG